MYHFYIKKVNGNYKWYGYFDNTKEINKLIRYWNFMYPERYIEPVR